MIHTSITAKLHHKSGISYNYNISKQIEHQLIVVSPGVAMPPAAKLTTGRRFNRATSLRRWNGADRSFANAYNSSSFMELARRMSAMTARWCLTASTIFPVPASPLVRMKAAPSEIRLSASPRFLAPHTKGTLKVCLLMWCCSSAGVRTSDSSM